MKSWDKYDQQASSEGMAIRNALNPKRPSIKIKMKRKVVRGKIGALSRKALVRVP